MTHNVTCTIDMMQKQISLIEKKDMMKTEEMI